MFFKKRDAQPTDRMLRAIAEHRRRQQTGERPDLLGAVYHGGCISCVYLKDNDTRSGIEWCLGCCYSNYNQSLPDRSAILSNID